MLLWLLSTAASAQVRWVTVSHVPFVPNNSEVTISWPTQYVISDPVTIEISVDPKQKWQLLSTGPFSYNGWYNWTSFDHPWASCMIRVRGAAGDTLYSPPFELGLPEKIGVKEHAPTPLSLQPYPNPTHGTLHIPHPDGEGWKLLIFDQQGVRVPIAAVFSQGGIDLPCDRLASGSYRYELRRGTELFIKSFQVVK